ncbi:unnamed protein product [Bursaphelenchus xylophilus]|uniref:(pine wood nematode) hypothetical protein n=1 Tax=Bursaphelenchus xylophilus TaxID=6326 RepID=A0A1I7RUD1_BURXY|nr:unnamed protein product [Bursaphelenchus xylophilus]CAG9114040.1 unnamed protein product [Bursaphelenchus xylophilus]
MFGLVKLFFFLCLVFSAGKVAAADDSVTCIVNNCQSYQGSNEYDCIPNSSCHGKLYDKTGKFIRDV